MCIAVPSPVVELFDAGLPMARVQRGAQTVEVCAAWVPEVQVGDHVIVSNGFIVEVMDAEAAARSLAAFAEVGTDLSFLNTPSAQGPDARPAVENAPEAGTSPQ